ncbi:MULTISPECIES: OmpA family protein [unclassified Caballeronia]|uniref:OmpA family protein n=1 Tax=unclassified Caballeronia TaxID=2646786 RepID=UPI0028589106|nr:MULTISPECIES: OmpA family protein [unclassified Caballeronia]MDR5775157.1 OmpA family protein [Caballeronia sp. LZ002]MDR5850595.1 OmpA family protein [Caballeronia sp. LZ003]
MFNKTIATILASVAVLAACSSTSSPATSLASSPTFNLSEIQTSNGQKAFRAECYGLFEGGSQCMAAAQKACGNQPVNPLQNVAGTKTPDNASELIFVCGAPAQLVQPAAAEPAPPAVVDTATVAPVAPAARKISLDEKTNFDFNSAHLTPKAKASLDQIISEGRGTTFSSVSIEGHTDSVGSAPYNLALSQRRAESVLEYLKSHGLKANEFSMKGFGKSVPVASNATSQGRAENRRVEVTLNP